MPTHIFTADMQPATRYFDCYAEPPFRFRIHPRHLLPAWCCRKRRWAKYLRAQVFYDGTLFWCAPGHGCRR